eukprot:scaffold82898_cov54-Phaeocystis_antarctica.AAC.2
MRHNPASPLTPPRPGDVAGGSGPARTRKARVAPREAAAAASASATGLAAARVYSSKLWQRRVRWRWLAAAAARGRVARCHVVPVQ